MLKLAVRLVFAMALAGFSTTALVGTAFAQDKDKKEEKADKDTKKKKEKKAGKDDEKGGW